jgi:hypothetical protein
MRDWRACCGGKSFLAHLYLPTNVRKNVNFRLISGLNLSKIPNQVIDPGQHVCSAESIPVCFRNAQKMSN